MNPITDTVVIALVAALWAGLAVVGAKILATRTLRRRQVNPLARLLASGPPR